MNTKYLMIASVIVTGLLGLGATFLPQEILSYIGLPTTRVTTLALQIMGALYLGFAMMNWMSREAIIGGIYSRPLVMGNFLHFMIAALALIKGISFETNLKYVWLITILYSLFALLFGVALFTNPKKKNVD